MGYSFCNPIKSGEIRCDYSCTTVDIAYVITTRLESVENLINGALVYRLNILYKMDKYFAICGATECVSLCAESLFYDGSSLLGDYSLPVYRPIFQYYDV